MTQGFWHLPPDRYFSSDPAIGRIARELYETVVDLPLICPHGHVDPALFSKGTARFGSPADLLIIPDHYVFRMLYSQGIPLPALGIPRGTGETDHRKIWQRFAENFYLFRGTPTGLWMTYMFSQILDVPEKLNGHTAQSIYDRIVEKLASPEFQPRRLFDQFNVEVLCTTDFAADSLEHHRAIRSSGWAGDIRPTFRPDDVVHLLRPGWKCNIERLSDLTGISISSYNSLIQALEKRRSDFRALGAVASDTDGTSLATGALALHEAEAIFQRALRGLATSNDAARFFGHMLMESARMSIEDGLVMQVHFGSFRNHNRPLYDLHGPDMGCDIPFQAEFTRNLRPLLNNFGSDPRLTLVIFTLDESTYSRELAPLAGHYPALKLGGPWWVNDSINGMRRYFEQVIETTGLYNIVGFADDTRSFPSLPARHDLWRRSAANWLAGLVVRGVVDDEDAREMILDLAYRLAKRTYFKNVD